MRRAGIFFTVTLLAGPALQAQAGLGQVQQSLSQNRFAEAAKELQEIVLQSGPSLKKPAPAEEKVLRGAIASMRRFLNENHLLAERNAARQVLCLSRAGSGVSLCCRTYVHSSIDILASKLYQSNDQKPERIRRCKSLSLSKLTGPQKEV